MEIKQLSVFVENKPGRLADITNSIAKAEINIRAICIADTSNFGILRLIVDKPEEACEVLRKEGITVSLTNVIAIGIDDEAGAFAKAVTLLSKNDISIEYAYAFTSRTKNKAFVILRVNDNANAEKIFTENNIPVIKEEIKDI